MRARIELSEKQRKIVFAENRAICVKASAGSGKTRVMTERVRYLLGKTRKRYGNYRTARFLCETRRRNFVHRYA